MWRHRRRLADLPMVDSVLLGAAWACLLLVIAAGVALVVAATAP
jgi:hypothetical protein